jgi:mercuric ion transport protein
MSGQVERSAYAPPGTPTPVAGGRRSKTLLSAGGLLAALATSSCCLLPFVLFTLGVGGAWVGNLTALAPYQPMFLVLAVTLLGTGFYRVYHKPKAAVAVCSPGSACADPRADRVAKTVLWSATFLVVAGITFPWLARLLIET